MKPSRSKTKEYDKHKEQDDPAVISSVKLDNNKLDEKTLMLLRKTQALSAVQSMDNRIYQVDELSTTVNVFKNIDDRWIQTNIVGFIFLCSADGGLDLDSESLFNHTHDNDDLISLIVVLNQRTEDDFSLYLSRSDSITSYGHFMFVENNKTCYAFKFENSEKCLEFKEALANRIEDLPKWSNSNLQPQLYTQEAFEQIFSNSKFIAKFSKLMAENMIK